jgi:Tfp pilus assembly protein PilO
MNEHRHLIFAIAGGVLILLLGGALLVWPNYRKTREIRQEIAELEEKISDLAGHTGTVERLADELAVARARVDSELKVIPKTADVAGLMRRLSLPVDGRTVLDQTFTAGNACDAAPGESFTERSMPLTVDMQARFDSVFALICAAERMDRLVRVSSVRLAAERSDAGPTVPMLTASVGLEAIYDAPAVEEGS